MKGISTVLQMKKAHLPSASGSSLGGIFVSFGRNLVGKEGFYAGSVGALLGLDGLPDFLHILFPRKEIEIALV